ncbi:MAG: carbamoyl-phosphate synthase small subunit, partial [Pseudonocardiales bacterium]|nr:carbamoyl-phosphate synthase small subunit [Pseudonocardiales bacterium]
MLTITTAVTKTTAVERGLALLVLEDGTIVRGETFGEVGLTLGDAVFATGMTGYQETLTDPS